MLPLPERIRELEVEIAGPVAGRLLKHSVHEFRYLDADVAQPALSLLMPKAQPTYQDGDMFPALEQNLPEGDWDGRDAVSRHGQRVWGRALGDSSPEHCGPTRWPASPDIRLKGSQGPDGRLPQRMWVPPGTSSCA